jgi:hypothetical protein
MFSSGNVDALSAVFSGTMATSNDLVAVNGIQTNRFVQGCYIRLARLDHEHRKLQFSTLYCPPVEQQPVWDEQEDLCQDIYQQAGQAQLQSDCPRSGRDRSACPTPTGPEL